MLCFQGRDFVPSDLISGLILAKAHQMKEQSRRRFDNEGKLALIFIGFLSS